jgi:hypothetical protein
MQGVCTSCPGAETIDLLVQSRLDVVTIQYKQWAVTDRAALMTVTQLSEKLLEHLVPKTLNWFSDPRHNLVLSPIYRQEVTGTDC